VLDARARNAHADAHADRTRHVYAFAPPTDAHADANT